MSRKVDHARAKIRLQLRVLEIIKRSLKKEQPLSEEQTRLLNEKIRRAKKIEWNRLRRVNREVRMGLGLEPIPKKRKKKPR